LYLVLPTSPESRGPFRPCTRRSDCGALKPEEGGAAVARGGRPEAGDCFRHQDRRNVFSGICLAKRSPNF
jgi:hypothetical protein